MSDSAPPIPFDPPSPTATLPSRPVSPLWRRFLAFAIDGLLLALLGNAIGVVLFNKLSDLGPWGRLVGFLIALPYFALFESNLGDGQIAQQYRRLTVTITHGYDLGIASGWQSNSFTHTLTEWKQRTAAI